MPTDLNELERLLAEATPGPWAFNPDDFEDSGYFAEACITHENEKGDPMQILVVRAGSHDTENGEMAVAAVNALPALIEELRELRADRERLVKAAGEVLYRIKGDPRMEGGAYYRIAPATHPDTHKAIIGLQAAIDAARVHAAEGGDLNVK